jgi:succinyl-CoA synthetase alpha subunit
MSILKTQSKSRLVGANAPGIIAPIGQCRIGFQPLPTFAPGHVGIAAKSGTLSYEAVASVTRAGLGQSLCIGMGGDIVAGTNLVDSLKVFEQDPETEGIILIGELGGRAEIDAADWIKDYRKREKNPKPIAAILGGIQAPSGRIMGHAGAWTARGEQTATEKLRMLQDVGVTMVDHPENFGKVMKELLSKSGRDPKKIMQDAANQKRSYHTSTRRPLAEMQRQARHSMQQKRGLVLKPGQAPGVLEPYLSSIQGLSITQDDAPKTGFYMSVTIDRTSREPSLATAATADISQLRHRLQSFPYSYIDGPPQETINAAITHAQLDAAPPAALAQAAALLSALSKMYVKKEAVTLGVVVSISKDGDLLLHAPTMHLQFDDSAFKSAKRQQDISALRQPATEDPDEVEAEADGIVYVRLHPDNPAANIGTLVNGAGLAMNTLDALHLHSGMASNFLDTGGKATSATVKKSFELILRDPRVKVIFVNIFGGLTDGGMIAEGVLLAFKEVDMRGVPVVVRIRGTNEAIGQKIIAESGLGLEAFDGFAEAAERVVELANGKS